MRSKIHFRLQETWRAHKFYDFLFVWHKIKFFLETNSSYTFDKYWLNVSSIWLVFVKSVKLTRYFTSHFINISLLTSVSKYIIFPHIMWRNNEKDKLVRERNCGYAFDIWWLTTSEIWLVFLKTVMDIK